MKLLCSTYYKLKKIKDEAMSTEAVFPAVDWHTVAVANWMLSIFNDVTAEQSPLSFTFVDPFWYGDTS